MKKLPLADIYPPAVGGLAAIAVTLVVRTLIGTRLLAEMALDAMLGYLPGESFSELLGVFGEYGKALFFASTLLILFIAYILIWLLLQKRTGAGRERRAMLPVTAAGSAFAFVMVVSVALVTLTDAALRNTGWVEYGIVAALASMLFAGIAGAQSRSATASSFGGVAVDAPAANGSRRQVIRLLPGLALGGLALVVIARTLRDAASGGVQASRRGEATKPVTPNNEFYVVSKNLIDPRVDGSTWRLKVGGLVGNRLELAYEDLIAFAPAEQYTTMQCISNEVGGELMGNAYWRGVRLKSVLERAGLLAGASFVMFRAADGYAVGIPLEFALRDQVVLAYQMNGEQLSHKHGYPVRLLSPGIYGMMHPKWITDIILMDEEVKGYWQQQGWSQEARMNTSIRIDLPAHRSDLVPGRPTVIEGIAFSGDRGISKVEVSTDDGATWQEAALKPPLGPYTWVLWDFRWTPSAVVGTRINIQARATDGDGVLQTAERAAPYPDGATGYHVVDVKIVEPAQTGGPT